MRLSIKSKLRLACRQFGIWLASISGSAILMAQGPDKIAPDVVTQADIIKSVYATDLSDFQATAIRFITEKKRLTAELMDVVRSKQLPMLSRCSAAYYLGIMRDPEAVEILASNVTLEFNPMKVPNFAYPILPQYPAMDALIKIGSPASPVLIGKLSESSDKSMREMLMKSLCQIDVDKDITRFRLEKALKAEKDSKRQARLQSALRMLKAMK